MIEKNETALVTIEPVNELAVFTTIEKVDPILVAIRKIVADFKPDVSTAKGRKEIASMAYKVAQSKTYLDGIGKKLTDEYKEIPKKIDANRKRIRDELDRLKDEVRKPLTDWESAEAARVQGIKDRIAVINQHAFMAAQAESSEQISEMINRVAGVEIDGSFAEFRVEAQSTKDAVIARLYAAKDAATKREAERAELARLREEAAKRESEERDRRIAEAAAEKARRDAEEKAAREKAEAERKAKEERDAAERRELELKLAAERAERERIEAIERAEREKQAAVEAERNRQEEAERARLAEEARFRADAERRAADLAHRDRIHAEVVTALNNEGCPWTNAQNVVALIAAGVIPHVKITY